MSKATNPPDKFANGWISQLDGRTGIAQELRQRYKSLVNDLGGHRNLSYQQRSLVERSLWLEYFLQQQEQVLATGGDFDSGRWTQAVNSLQGIYAKLGLERKAKEVPNLSDFIKKGEQ